jgi:hypothetical protein
MSRHLPTVANAFYIAAALLGLPALPGFLYFGFAALRLRLLTPASTAVSSSPDVMVNLIETGARIFGSVFKFIGDAGQWVITAFTAICFLILLLAGALFLIGRGLHAHAAWARAVGALFVLSTLLVSLVGMLSLRRGGWAISSSLVAISTYATWVLLRRFA